MLGIAWFVGVATLAGAIVAIVIHWKTVFAIVRVVIVVLLTIQAFRSVLAASLGRQGIFVYRCIHVIVVVVFVAIAG